MMTEDNVMRIRITLDEEILGSTPSNKEIFSDYIAQNSPNAEETEAEELQAIPEDKQGVTVFPRTTEGEPFIYDYQLRGFFKESIGALSKAGKDGYKGGKACSQVKAYKKLVDQQIFIKPRQIVWQGLPDGWKESPTYCERPLRASTPQGERVALAKSETIPAGSYIEFEVFALTADKIFPLIEEALEYGKWHGLGQWRNSGKGSFTYEIIE